MPRRKKPLLVDSVTPRLPKHVVEGKKRGFALPFDRWLRQDMRTTVEGALSRHEAAEAVGLDSRAVRDVLNVFLQGHGGTGYWTRPWGLFVLMAWCRAHGVTV
jgi:hypothetical protein